MTLDPATHRPSRAVQDIPGAGRLDYVYSDYTRRHGISLPIRVQIYFAGRLQEDLRLGGTRVASAPEALFRAPAGYLAPPAPGRPDARRLAEGLYFFENMPGGYHSAVVDAGDHLLLLEAPLSPAYATAQKEVLERLFPGKRVRYVFVTHHHGDHVGGLGLWHEQGATLVAPAGARVALERQLHARGVAGTIRIEEVSGRRAFGTGPGRVEALSFVSAHVASHLLVWIPSARAVFQGDLFYVPDRGPVPRPFPIVADFRAQLRRARLSPDLILGVHGRPATGAELGSAGIRRR